MGILKSLFEGQLWASINHASKTKLCAPKITPRGQLLSFLISLQELQLWVHLKYRF